MYDGASCKAPLSVIMGGLVVKRKKRMSRPKVFQLVMEITANLVLLPHLSPSASTSRFELVAYIHQTKFHHAPCWIIGWIIPRLNLRQRTVVVLFESR